MSRRTDREDKKKQKAEAEKARKIAEEERATQELHQQFDTISRNHSKSVQQEWLRFLHQRYSDRFLKDNDCIWTISSIFIPLSLAGLASVKDGSFISTLLLAAGSTRLIRF